MIVFNHKDLLWYGTNAERLAVTLPDPRFGPTEKFYEYETQNAYVSDGATWYPI